jgi:integrase
MANSKIVKFKDKKGNEYPYLFIDEMTGEFYAVKRIGSDVKKKPLGREFVRARSKVLDAIQELSNEAPKITGNRLVKDFFEAMIEEKKALSIKDATMVRIESVWRLGIEPYWGLLTAEDVTQEQVTKFMTWHRRNRPGVQFVNTFKYLGNIFNVMVEMGALDPAKLPKLTIPKDEQKHHDSEKGRYVNPEDIQRILSVCDDETYLMISVAYAVGFRKTEWASVTKDRIKLHGDYYVVSLDTDDTKTGIARDVPLPRILTDRILAQIKASKSDFLFPMTSDITRPVYSQIVDKSWKSAKQAAGIKGRLRFHDLRHSAARNFAKSNVNPIIACTILGMSLSMYQKVYCKMQAKDLILAVEQSAAQIGQNR